MAIASVNLEQCYDQIAHSIASLGAQQWGVPLVATTSLLSTIQSMALFLHMAHGDSTVSYSATTDSTARAAQADGRVAHPYQGSCQGNDGRPALFQCSSSPCMDYMHQKNQVACFVAVFSLTVYKALGLLYVNDADLAAIAKYALESAKHVT